MSSVTLLAGTRKGAFLVESDGDRTEWTVRGPLLKGWEVSDLVLDLRDGAGDGAPGRLHAAVGHVVYGPTIHRSDDFGETWEQVEGTPAYPEDAERELDQVWRIEPGRADEPDTLYAGVAEAGLFVSRDGGDTWDEVPGLNEHGTRPDWMPGAGGLCCHTILHDPNDADRMWVGISAVGVFRTDDGGESWQPKNTGVEVVDPDLAEGGVGSCVHGLVLDPTDPGRLYQQNHRGVYRSTDAGDTWEPAGDGLPSTFGFPIAMHPRDPETLYTVPLESDEYRMSLDGQPAVYRTTDGGDSWTGHTEGFPEDSWLTVLRQAMTVDDLDPAGVYVGTTGGRIFSSRDEGETWAAIDCHLPRIFSLRAVVVD